MVIAILVILTNAPLFVRITLSISSRIDVCPFAILSTPCRRRSVLTGFAVSRTPVFSMLVTVEVLFRILLDTAALTELQRLRIRNEG